jgi:hypothetical protein
MGWLLFCIYRQRYRAVSHYQGRSCLKYVEMYHISSIEAISKQRASIVKGLSAINFILWREEQLVLPEADQLHIL